MVTGFSKLNFTQLQPRDFVDLECVKLHAFHWKKIQEHVRPESDSYRILKPYRTLWTKSVTKLRWTKRGAKGNDIATEALKICLFEQNIQNCETIVSNVIRNNSGSYNWIIRRTKIFHLSLWIRYTISFEHFINARIY